MSEPTERQDTGDNGSPVEKVANAGKGMTRRKFVIGLGAGTAASIVGYFLLRDKASPPSEPVKTEAGEAARPRLKDDVVFGKDGEMMTISRVEPASPTLCAVNATGAEVVERLDGQHTIEEISQAVAKVIRVVDAHTLDAKIAYFVAQVGMLGFLAEPFYATIFENTGSHTEERDVQSN